MNTLKKEREQKSPEENYPWLDPDDDRRHMTDIEILEKYINLNKSCLNKEEKMKVWIYCTSIRKHLVSGMK